MAVRFPDSSSVSFQRCRRLRYIGQMDDREKLSVNLDANLARAQCYATQNARRSFNRSDTTRLRNAANFNRILSKDFVLL